jgi:ribA/ribD-fused uncharacterized protein
MGLVANQNVQKCMAFESSGFLMINEFKNEYAFLSNFFVRRITYQGIEFASNEHAFQAAKASTREEMIWVAEAPTPGKAKYRGRQVTLRQDWESVKIRVMYEICKLKFEIPTLRILLDQTGDKKLVEGNYWHDQFWGNCLCPQHADIEGHNYLGRILMHIRNAQKV